MSTMRLAALALGILLLVVAVAGLLSGRRLAADARRARGEAAGHLATARRLEDILDGTGDALLVTDETGVITYASARVRELLGVTPESMLLSQVTELVKGSDRDKVAAILGQARTAVPGQRLRVEYRALHSDGSNRTVEAHVATLAGDASTRGLVWSLRDPTGRGIREEPDDVALHDRLTGLPNRALLVDHLEQALARARRAHTQVATVSIDVDEFQETWDRLGYRAAEELVITAAGRLESAVRPGDLVARTGVDEFALLIDGFKDVKEVLEVAQYALSMLAMPVTAGGSTLEIGASAGIAVSDPDHATRAEELLQHASVAMTLAKRSEERRMLLFEESMTERTQRPFDLTVDLLTATTSGQISVVYQPIVRLDTLQLAGFEALARWDHPERGPIPPANFIPVAEDTGDIIALGRHVLETACREMVSWGDHPGRRLRIAVNVSPRQLAEDAIVADVRQVLADTGLPPEQLVLEITESVVHDDVASVQRRLNELRTLGVRIAMDDFGTGFSSLSYLRRLPLDILKIDRSFIVDSSDAGPALLAAVIDIGVQLGLDTVAEGIELPEQLDAARASGCTFGQGYLFARPLVREDAVRFIAEHRPTKV